MAYIYKITNLITDQVYIGLTSRTVEQRWKEHLRGTQLIDTAIANYGRDNFQIETIEECTEEEMDDREIYWINFYDSFHTGYNRTLGGRENKLIMTDKIDLVEQLWHQGLTVNRIVAQTKLNVETVRLYLKKRGIDHDQIRARANIFIGKAKAKPIAQYDLDDNFIRYWPSASEAARVLHGNRRNISAVCAGQRRASNGFKWKFVEKEDNYEGND